MSVGDAAPPVASQADWEALVADLPDLISQLVDAEAFGAANPPVSSKRGIYLFSEGGHHLYVGRTSITARSRHGNRLPCTSFSQRWKQHCGEKSAPNAASLAMKLADQVSKEFGVPDPAELKRAGVTERVSDWWKLRKVHSPPDFFLVFQAAKEFIREDLEFRYVELEDDLRGVRSHVSEVYADVTLQTEFGDFSTS
jgi:hypothetical protein